MNMLAILLVSLLSFFEPVWLTDMSKAKTEATDSHKAILLNFSGSDWCVPCIRMEKEIFHSKEFTDYSEANLVLVNADFPRLKKHELSKEQTARNEALAEQYNPEGHFPLTLLLDASGKVLKTWDGYPSVNAGKFVSEINTSIHASD
jgi:thioredoxin-related protein